MDEGLLTHNGTVRFPTWDYALNETINFTRAAALLTFGRVNDRVGAKVPEPKEPRLPSVVLFEPKR
jgi:hypothetical protein